jgi:prolyl-tRNA synthetase
MRWSRYFINTLREVPSDADVISQKLMMRAGLIRKVAAGIYTYLPLGLRSIQKLENIVRQEMTKAGSTELLMPAIQPAELWMESKRWQQYGKELLRIKDRHDRDFVFGPHPRGGHHGHGPGHDQLVPAAPGEPVPDPDEVPGRGPSALRPDARARVHHEGRVLLPRSRESLDETYEAMRDAYSGSFIAVR